MKKAKLIYRKLKESGRTVQHVYKKIDTKALNKKEKIIPTCWVMEP